MPSFIISAAAGGAPFDYYLSTTGNDSNAGTVGAPWAMTSLQDTNSNNALMAGKRVGFIGGTYNVASMTSGSSPSDYQHPIFHIPSGSSGSPTYVGSSDASGHESPRAAVFVSSSSAGVNAVFGQNPNSAGYWTLSGVVINGNSYPNSLVYASYPTSPGTIYTGAGTAPGIAIQNCEIYGIAATAVGANEACIFLQGALNAIVTNNKLHDVTKPAQPDHAHCYEEYACSGTQFTYNTVYNATSGAEAKAGSGGTIVAYNYLYNCSTNALEGFDGAEGNPNSPSTAYSIHHNVFDSCGPVHACDVNNTTSQAIDWHSNTIYDTRSNSNVTLDLRSSAANLITLHDTIVVATANSGGDSYGGLALTSGGVVESDYNCFDYNTNTGGWGLSGTLQNSLSAWQSAASLDAHSIASNPQFVSTIVPGAGPNQFKLGSGSPCLGTGTGGINMGAWDGLATQIGSNF